MRKSEFEKERAEKISIAKDLRYDKIILRRLKNATSYNQLENIMTEGRNRMK